MQNGTRLFEWNGHEESHLEWWVPVMLGDAECLERSAEGVVHATMPILCTADRFAGATEFRTRCQDGDHLKDYIRNR
jgi:hypothetical protein